MGLKNLKSQFDLVPGPTAPVGNMDSMQGPQFDNGVEPQGNSVDTIHERSLTQPYNYQHGNSPEVLTPTSLDLNGEQGPQFNNGVEPTGDLVDTIHERSLTQNYSYNHGGTPGLANASTLDLDGLPDPSYNTLNGTSDSPFNSRNGTGDHMIDLLTGLSTSTNSGRTYKPDGNPGMHDLNGNEGPSFNMGADSTLKQDLLANIYQSAMNPGASYGAGQPGATWPSVNPGSIDLDGIAPEGYANPDTGATYG